VQTVISQASPYGSQELGLGQGTLIGAVLLVPAGKEAEYYSVYEVSDRGTSWLGPLLFGLTYQLTGDYRDAVISLLVFFAVGFALLVRVPMRRAVAEAGNPVPEMI
jgi:UMF1 family MFS transporter